MAKKKSFSSKKSENKSSRFSKKTKTPNVKLNPFEVRVNRKKHNVLGQKTEKNERGLPGISRSRANEKRKKTLLKEFKNRNKSNNVVDKRFGENNEKMTQEEKLLQRQIQHVKRRHDKASIYNLEEETELTHYGQSLGNMESFDDLQLSSDDDNNDVDNTETHFGGFLRKKRPLEGNGEDNGPKEKTRKQAIDEIVAKSKLHKHERQKEKVKVEELLEEIDVQWKTIQSLMPKATTKDKSNSNTNDIDDFDRYLKELEAQPRAAMATERMKTDEEIALSEKERLELLEHERQRRMKGLKTNKHVQFEDSGDKDITSLRRKIDKRVMLKYEDGNVVLPVDSPITDDNSNDGLLETKAINDEEGDSDNDDSGDGDSGEEEIDICDDDDSDKAENDNNVEDVIGDDDTDENGDSGDDGIGDRLIDSKDTNSDKVSENIPFVFEDVPNSIDKIISLLNGRSPIECEVIMDRIIVCHSTALSTNNVGKMESLFSCLLDYCILLTKKPPLTFVVIETLHHLAKSLYKSGLASPKHSAACIQKHLQSSFKRYQQIKRGKYQFPSNSDIILFKIIGILFPTSDYCHPVTTPTMHLMTLSLSKTVIKTVTDVVRLNFICQILIEYIGLSKRFVPELVNYLTGIMKMYLPHKSNVIPPFNNKVKSIFTNSLSTLSTDTDQSLLSLFQLISESNHNNNTIGLSLLNITVSQLYQLSCLWHSLPSYDIIFDPIKTILTSLKEIPTFRNCDELLKSLNTVTDTIDSNSHRPRPILQLFRQKPKSIKFFEPAINLDYQPHKKRFSHKKVGEQVKLQYKHKRELKGAVREIRKDNKFLAREKIKEQIDMDAIRKKKVNQIQGWLQQERGEERTERIKRKK